MQNISLQNTPKQSGLSILELLVVAALIIFALSIVASSLTGLRAKNRDTTRMTDLGEITKALNTYYADKQLFPIFPAKTVVTGEDELSKVLKKADIIKTVPADPLHPQYSYAYQSNGSGSTYSLSFCLETENIQGYAKGCGHEMKP